MLQTQASWIHMSKGSKNPWKHSHRNKLIYIYIFSDIYTYRFFYIYDYMILVSKKKYIYICYAHLVVTYHSFHPKHVPIKCDRLLKNPRNSAHARRLSALHLVIAAIALATQPQADVFTRVIRLWRWLVNLNAHPKIPQLFSYAPNKGLIFGGGYLGGGRLTSHYWKEMSKSKVLKGHPGPGGKEFWWGFREQFLTRWHKSLTCMTEMHQMKQVLK